MKYGQVLEDAAELSNQIGQKALVDFPLGKFTCHLADAPFIQSDYKYASLSSWGFGALLKSSAVATWWCWDLNSWLLINSPVP